MRKLLLILIVLLFSNLSFTRSWYLRVSGSQTNAGTSWGTARALSGFDWTLLNAGDIVYIDGGMTSQTYNLTDTITLTKSGSSSAPITIKKGIDYGYSGNVILTSQSGSNIILLDMCQNSTGVSYNNIDGLTFQNATSANLDASKTSNCKISNCTFTPNTTGYPYSYPIYNIYMWDASNMTIEGCTITNASTSNVYAYSANTCTLKTSTISSAPKTYVDGSFNCNVNIRASENMVITSCTIYNGNVNIWAGGTTLSTYINNCSFRDAVRSNIYFYDDVQNSSIVNCNLNTYSTYNDNSCKSIWMTNARQCTVSTCSLYVTGTDGLAIDRSSDIVVEENVIWTEVQGDENTGGTSYHQIDCIAVGGFADYEGENDGHTIRYNKLINNSEYDNGHDDCLQIYVSLWEGDTWESGDAVKRFGGSVNDLNTIQIYGNWFETTNTSTGDNWAQHEGWPLKEYFDQSNACIINGDTIGNWPGQAAYQELGQYCKWQIWSNIFKTKNKNALDYGNMQSAELKVFNNTFYAEDNIVLRKRTTLDSPWNNQLGASFLYYNDFEERIRNTYIYNNIFYTAEIEDEPNVQFGTFFESDRECSDGSKYNNLATNAYLSYPWFTGTVEIENNDYWFPTSTSSSKIVGIQTSSSINSTYNLSNWQSFETKGFDSPGGLQHDPLFVTNPPINPSDFQLDDIGTDWTEISPCVDTGYRFSTTSDYNKAYDGTIRGSLNNDEWDIGAWETVFIPLRPDKISKNFGQCTS